MWVIPILVLLVSAVVLVIVTMLLGPVVSPIYEVVVSDAAVQRVGFDTGAEVAMRIGAQFVLPLLALALVIWFLVLRLASDQYQGIQRR